MVILLSVLLSLSAISQIIYDKTEKELEDMCRIVNNLLPDTGIVTLNDIEAMSLYATSGTSVRLTIIQYSGSVLADSQSNYRNMRNHFDRPEVMDAFLKDVGHSVRLSETLGIEMVYAAIAVPSKSFIIRTSMPVTDVHRFFSIMRKRLFPYSILIFCLSMLFTFLFTNSINSTLKLIRGVTKKYASGDFSAKLPARSDDLGELTDAINSMGSQLGERIDTITAQRDEIQAIVSGMINPVILIDDKMTVLEMNPAAMHLTGATEGFKGRQMESLIKNQDVINIASACLSKKVTQEAAICLDTEKGIYYFIYASYINGTVLMVMNDISGMKQLDEMRKEFSINVSHELKTPVTSIMGYVDTLLSIYKEHPENIGKFLEIIKKQSERLAGIIEDLLTLSRTESSYIRLEKERIPARTLIELCVSEHAEQAAQKHTHIKLDINDDVMILAHPVLAQQAIGNLLENAVKYSPENATVIIHSRKNGEYTEISVQDNGPGIDDKNLSHIFEKFYRVNKEVSRSLGGTGLGLSIVKQVAITHGGKVSVESTVGKGTTFTIYFPV
ncbi:MAG: ATP-binding protein [Spirochaetia bacterium]|nr:ATP-binding protein [Spirochaetia bacterium]